MRTTRPLQTLLAVSLVAFLPWTSPELEAAEKKPNIVLFLVDDMGWMDSGVYGSEYYETPAIDQFAQRAMRFTQAYGQPTCSPTRASILTGKYPTRHGIFGPSGHLPPQPPEYNFMPTSASPLDPMIRPQSKNYLEPSEYTLAEALKDAGYRTALIGKWHIGANQPHWPEQQGFDVAWHCHPDAGPPGKYFSPYGVVPDGEPRWNRLVGTITDGPRGEYIVDRQADEAVEFIASSEGKPFFLKLSSYGVHGPWGYKEEYAREFAKKTDPRGLQGNPIMASMLKSVDECFARILDELDKRKLTDNTIIIFYSDNGGNTHENKPGDSQPKESDFMKDWRKWAGDRPPTNNSPLRGSKGDLYEGGTRVPMMWAWADHIKGGTVSDSVVGHIDIYPTLLELAGIDLPAPEKQLIDGESLAPVLFGKAQLGRKAFFNYFPSRADYGAVTVVSGDYKLIRWFNPESPRELYNLREDIGETKDLAEMMPGKVRELDASIGGFLKDTHALVPKPNPNYNPNDPLEGWQARGCKATVADGVLTMAAEGAEAFLGQALKNTKGPLTVKMRVRSSMGGEGLVKWISNPEVETVMQTVRFQVPATDWQELAVTVPEKGKVGIIRLYLPATGASAELDWVEITPKGASPQRWEFGGAGK